MLCLKVPPSVELCSVIIPLSRGKYIIHLSFFIPVSIVRAPWYGRIVSEGPVQLQYDRCDRLRGKKGLLI